jgi:hypothetical protein
MHSLPKDTRGADASLTVDIIEDEIVIRIGIGTLAWAFEHMHENNPYNEAAHDFVQTWKVTDLTEFAEDVVGELTNEEEDGSHPLNLLLDQVCSAAVEQGSVGIDESTDGKSAYGRDYEKETQ